MFLYIRVLNTLNTFTDLKGPKEKVVCQFVTMNRYDADTA